MRRLGLYRAASTKNGIIYRVSTRGPRAPVVLRIRATYVDPDVSLTLIQLKDLVL